MPTHCPLVDWFVFEDKCKVKTCKYHTTRTKHGCLSLDHSFPSGDRIISDSELVLYKFAGKDMDVKGVMALKRKTQIDVKACLVMYSFLEYIKEREKYNFEYEQGQSEEIDYYIKISSLRFKRIGFKTWMLPYIVSNKVWESFVLAKHVDDKITLNSCLLLKTKDFQRFKYAILRFNNNEVENDGCKQIKINHDQGCRKNFS